MATRNRYADMRRACAELALLERFDAYRSALGHDYGCGQRGAELSRRRRALEALEETAPILEGPTGAELAEAWKRVGAPRSRRVAAEAYRRETPSTRRTARAWNLTEAWIERCTDV